MLALKVQCTPTVDAHHRLIKGALLNAVGVQQDALNLFCEY